MNCLRKLFGNNTQNLRKVLLGSDYEVYRRTECKLDFGVYRRKLNLEKLPKDYAPDSPEFVRCRGKYENMKLEYEAFLKIGSVFDGKKVKLEKKLFEEDFRSFMLSFCAFLAQFPLSDIKLPDDTSFWSSDEQNVNCFSKIFRRSKPMPKSIHEVYRNLNYDLNFSEYKKKFNRQNYPSIQDDKYNEYMIRYIEHEHLTYRRDYRTFLEKICRQWKQGFTLRKMPNVLLTDSIIFKKKPTDYAFMDDFLKFNADFDAFLDEFSPQKLQDETETDKEPNEFEKDFFEFIIDFNRPPFEKIEEYLGLPDNWKDWSEEEFIKFIMQAKPPCRSKFKEGVEKIPNNDSPASGCPVVYTEKDLNFIDQIFFNLCALVTVLNHPLEDKSGKNSCTNKSYLHGIFCSKRKREMNLAVVSEKALFRTMVTGWFDTIELRCRIIEDCGYGYATNIPEPPKPEKYKKRSVPFMKKFNFFNYMIGSERYRKK